MLDKTTMIDALVKSSSLTREEAEKEIDELLNSEKNAGGSFDGSNKSAVGGPRNIPYHTAMTPELAALIARQLSIASDEALQFIDPFNDGGQRLSAEQIMERSKSWSTENYDQKTPNKVPKGTPIGAKVYVDSMTLSNEEWHEVRKLSIGSSAASSVCGDNHFKGATNLDLYYQKHGIKPRFDDTDSTKTQVFFAWGHVLEEFLQQYCGIRWPGCKMLVDTNIYTSATRPYLSANLDGMLQMPDGTWTHLEFKTANAFSGADAYANGSIPVYYKRQLIQCQHIMNVWRSRIIACMDRDNIQVRDYVRDLDEEMEQIKMCDEFWNENVQQHVPPIPNGTVENNLHSIFNYSEGIAKRKIAQPIYEDEFLQAIEEYREADEEYKSAKKTTDYLKEEREKHRLDIVNIMAQNKTDYASTEDDDCRFEVKNKEQGVGWTMTSDQLTRLKEERLGMYNTLVENGYITEKTPSVRFSVSAKKKRS